MKMIKSLILPVGLAAVSLLATGCEDVNILKAKNNQLTQRNERISQELRRKESMIANQSARLKTLQTSTNKLKDDNRLKRDQLLAKDKKLARLERLIKDLNKPTDTQITIGSTALPKELNKALKAFAAANPNVATFDEKVGMVKLKSDFTFPSGSANVNQNAQDALKKLVEILNTPAAKDFSVYVAGHTDDMRIGKPSTRRLHPTNWHLSVHRAIGVQKVLAADGLSPRRIAVMGFGEYHPVVPNKPNKRGAEGNRRVEIWIVPSGSFLTPQAGGREGQGR